MKILKINKKEKNNFFIKELKKANDDVVGALFNLVSEEMEQRNILEFNIEKEEFQNFIKKAPLPTIKTFKEIIEEEEQIRK